MGLLIGRAAAAGAALAWLAGAAPPGAEGDALITAEEALRSAFSAGDIRRESVFLTPAQRQKASEAAGVPLPSQLVTRYRMHRDGRSLGYGYLDTHRVRTKNETLLVMLHADGRVRRVEVLAFDEPPDYLPRRPFYDQFDRRPLDDELSTGRAIRPVTGATLTARSTLSAVRRALAIHAVLATETE